MSYSCLQQLLLRSACFVYAVAFLGAWLHNSALIGSGGLLPASAYLDRVANHFGTSRQEMRSASLLPMVPQIATSPLHNTVRAFHAAPTLFWWAPEALLDTVMEVSALVGFLISTLVAVTGRANMLAMLLLWALYFSIVSVGQSFYSFGWESQLLETGMIAAFLVYPIQLTKPHAMPVVPIMLFRWLLFRVMFGSGMIKLRGDPCWRDMTCMQYHYQTQPIPNPLSRLFHATPKWFHALEVWANHFVEIVVPFFAVLPQPAATVCGVIQILFQLVIVAGGNLSFLNWLTMVPAAACLDERLLRWLVSLVRKTKPSPESSTGAVTPRARRWLRISARAPLVILHWSFALLIVYLSVPVVENLFSTSGQVMNASYDWLRLVNTHGNFGSITRTRMEITMEGRSTKWPSVWRAYEFPCKPGADLHRRPCFASPFHYRLDWLMWFAGFQKIEQNPWLVHLALKALQAHRSPTARAVLDDLGIEDPFEQHPADRPLEIRMRIQEYRLAPLVLGDGAAVAHVLQDIGRSVWSRNRTLSNAHWRVVGRARSYLDALDEDRLLQIVQQLNLNVRT